MDRLRVIIEQHARWQDLEIYIERIEAYFVSDFSHSLENAKALLETIGKEICADREIDLGNNPTMNSVLKKAFIAIGYVGDDYVTQISTSLANIAQQMGNLRNDIGMTAHGKSLDEIKKRNDKVDDLTKELLIETTKIIASFLIRGFEAENSNILPPNIEDKVLDYQVNEDFNEYLDDLFEEFIMGSNSYPASEVLYSVDISAYISEHKAFIDDNVKKAE